MRYLLSLLLLFPITWETSSKAEKGNAKRRRIAAISSYYGRQIADSLVFQYQHERLLSITGVWTDTRFVTDTTGLLKEDMYNDLESEKGDDVRRYEYENGLVKKRIEVNPMAGEPGETEYYYTSGKMDSSVMRVFTRNGLFDYITEVYQLDQFNEVKMVRSYWGGGRDKKLFETIEYQYDLSPNPLMIFRDVSILHDPKGACHNVIRMKITNMSGKKTVENEVTYSYRYGRNGYPLERWAKSTATMEGVDDTPLLKYYYE